MIWIRALRFGLHLHLHSQSRLSPRSVAHHIIFEVHSHVFNACGRVRNKKLIRSAFLDDLSKPCGDEQNARRPVAARMFEPAGLGCGWVRTALPDSFKLNRPGTGPARLFQVEPAQCREIAGERAP